VTMFRLDYLSCFLTVVATILLGRKMWTGLVVSGVNSLVVCVIGLHTSQYGFIPANVFCICINALNLRAWLKAQKDRSELTADASSRLLTGDTFVSTSEKPGTRRSLFRIRSEARLGSLILSLAAKSGRPFASTVDLHMKTKVGVPTLDESLIAQRIGVRNFHQSFRGSLSHQSLISTNASTSSPASHLSTVQSGCGFASGPAPRRFAHLDRAQDARTHQCPKAAIETVRRPRF
jgi:hypothetical protein